MTTKQVLDYQVIPESKTNKKLFNKLLKSGTIKLVGTFENEFGELFVICSGMIFPELFKEHNLLITGDEFDWSIAYEVDEKGNAFQRFYLSKDERLQAVKVLKTK